MPRRIAALLEPLLHSARLASGPAAPCGSTGDRPARALLLAYLLRIRPWRLAASGSVLESELREAMLAAWLRGVPPSAAQSRMLASVQALLSELGSSPSPEQAATSVSDSRLGRLFGSWARQCFSTLDIRSLPDAERSWTDSAPCLDAFDVAALDLLHAASGERPELVAILAELGCLRPAKARSGASLAGTVLRAALGPRASARLRRLAELGLLAMHEGGEDREPYCQIPWPLQLLWQTETTLQVPLALASGVSLWPLTEAVETTWLAAIWPACRSGSVAWTLSGGAREEALRVIGWLSAEPNTAGPCSRPDAPSSAVCYVVDLSAEHPDFGPWMRVARRLRPGPLLFCGAHERFAAERFTPQRLGEGPMFLLRGVNDAPLADERGRWPQLELAGGDLWSHGVAARLGAIEPRVATLWTEGLCQLQSPVRRIEALLRLELGSRADRQVQRAALEDVANHRMQSEGLIRLREPAAPPVMPSSTAEQLDEVLLMVRLCGEARRGERARGVLPTRLIVILEGERSVLQKRALWQIGLAWGQSVYEIDISQVLSRYIGEAEQRLAAIFAHARSSGCALFVDEAQGLLGKRTQMRRSVDRYSAMQVQSALQALEDFDGLFVLSCASGDELDSGVLSRALFRVRFASLSVDERADFWSRSMPSTAPLDDDIDWQVLAEDFALDPDQILRAGLLAAIDAARRGLPIGHELLIKACGAPQQRL